MQIYLQQTWGIIAKDLRQWSRDRQAALGPMMMPIVLMLIAAVLFGGGGGDEWPIGLVVEGNGPAAQEFAQTIEDLRGSISPYFRIVTRDPVEARHLVAAGRLHMVITIPMEFD